MSQKYNAPRGTQDVLPPDSDLYQFIADTARRVFRLYGYREIQTPVFEHTELFTRGIGEATDVISKEMYTFLDKKGRSLSLRPEGTAGTIRAYLEHNLGAQNPINKLFYIGPMFRYERPQAGRYRQHTQVGAECIGSANPLVDVEMIALFHTFIKNLGIKDVTLFVNSLGDEVCRPNYIKALKYYFQGNLSKLCNDCYERFTKNPLRILDCKNESCRSIVENSPTMQENLCAPCDLHFSTVITYLKELNIAYTINPRLVRGLDYYTRTVFEFQVSGFGTQNAIGGGGRYDKLIESLGGIPTPALGFGCGIERLALTLETQNIASTNIIKPSIVIVALGEKTYIHALSISEELRQKGIPVELDHRFGSFKSQLKYADKLGSPYVLILGEDELSKNIVLLKTMASGEQIAISLSQIADTLTPLIHK